jgi:hypothetical protein
LTRQLPSGFDRTCVFAGLFFSPSVRRGDSAGRARSVVALVELHLRLARRSPAHCCSC